MSPIKIRSHVGASVWFSCNGCTTYSCCTITWCRKSGAFGNASKGIGIHHLGSQLLTEWIIRVPPIKEQKEIISRIHIFFKTIDYIQQQYQETKGTIDQLDQSILAQVFRGAQLN